MFDHNGSDLFGSMANKHGSFHVNCDRIGSAASCSTQSQILRNRRCSVNSTEARNNTYFLKITYQCTKQAPLLTLKLNIRVSKQLLSDRVQCRAFATKCNIYNVNRNLNAKSRILISKFIQIFQQSLLLLTRLEKFKVNPHYNVTMYNVTMVTALYE